MTLKKVTEIIPGDVLKKDVRAPNGRFLFKKHTVLTEKHILVLKSWGVLKVEVESNKKTQITPGHLDEEIRDNLDSYFPESEIKSSPMKDIYLLSKKFRKKILNTNELPLTQLKKIDSAKKIALPTRLKISPEKLVASQKELCCLPNLYQKMMDVLNDPNSSAANIGEVVSKDSSLTAKLLRIVNSPHLGLVSKVETVSRAIAILGLEHLKLLTKGIILVESFKNIPSKIINMKLFWKHSISVGLMSSLLSSQEIDLIAEKFFIMGLLHDIGKLVMLGAMPGLYLNIIMHAKEERINLHQAEQKILGFNHSDIGALLFKKWFFPPSLIEIIKTHHHPQKSDLPKEASILFIANTLAQTCFYGFSGNVFIPILSKEIMRLSGLDINCLDVVIPSFFKQIKMLEKIFLS